MWIPTTNPWLHLCLHLLEAARIWVDLNCYLIFYSRCLRGFEFLSEFNSFSPQYLQNAQSGGLGCLYFTFKPTSCLSLQPVSVRGLYRLLWLDSRSTTLAGKLILWHSDALNARTESSLAACISQQSLQTHTACRSSYGFWVSCLDSCLVVRAMSGSATAQRLAWRF